MATMDKMLEEIEALQKMALAYRPPTGVMPMLHDDYSRLPLCMEELAKVWSNFHLVATDPKDGVPLAPPVMNALAALITAQQKLAVVAERIVPLALKIHQDKIDELADGRNAMWDHRANQGYTGPVSS